MERAKRIETEALGVASDPARASERASAADKGRARRDGDNVGGDRTGRSEGPVKRPATVWPVRNIGSE